MSLREYTYIPGDGSADLYIYIDSLDGIEELPARVNYFGKRGSFVQYVDQDEMEKPDLDQSGLPFELEDFSERAKWETVNIYSGNKPPRKRFKQYAQPTMTIHGVKHTLYKY
jgi:hypothetical protein